MQEKIKDCICGVCGLYWPCPAALKRHSKAHKFEKFDGAVEQSELFDEFANETLEPENDESIPMLVFANLRNHLELELVGGSSEYIRSEMPPCLDGFRNMVNNINKIILPFLSLLIIVA